MKKCYFILGLLISTNAFAAVDKDYGKMMQQTLKEFCFEMFDENTTEKIKAKEEDYCNKVAACVVNNAPNNFALTSDMYLQKAFMNCLQIEASKIVK